MSKSKSFSKSIKKSFSNAASGTGFFKNKIVLYIITFIALMNLFGYVLIQNYKAVTMFLAVGLIVFNFNKNMIIVLLCCLLATNLYVVATKTNYEGFQKKDQTKATKNATTAAADFANKTKVKKKSGFQTQGKNVVAKTAASVKDDSEEVNSRIDYGTTIERAYDNLDNILGGENMQKLTKDTSRLISKQNKLVKNMQGMAPMINQYKDLLKNMNLDSIQNLATKLTGGPLSLGASTK